MILDVQYDVDLLMYYADALTAEETLSVSIGKYIVRDSENHAKAHHPRFGGHRKKVTLSMKLGTIIDEILTNQEKRLELVAFKDFRSNDAKAAKARAEENGKLAVKQAELDKARDRAESVMKNLRYHGIDLDQMQKQVCILFPQRASNGQEVQCKALLDFVSPDFTLIRDLKSTKKCKPGPALDKKALIDHYHMQAAAYINAVTALHPKLAGRVRFENVWVEEEWPYEPALTEFGGDALALGQALWQEAIDRWEASIRTGRWPGYMQTREPHTIHVPDYMMAEAMAREAVNEDEEDEDEPEEDWGSDDDA